MQVAWHRSVNFVALVKRTVSPKTFFAFQIRLGSRIGVQFKNSSSRVSGLHPRGSRREVHVFRENISLERVIVIIVVVLEVGGGGGGGKGQLRSS